MTQVLYCAEADVDNRFGSVNIDKWAEIDGGDATTRKNWAIEQASRHIDMFLRGGVVDVPFAAITDTPATPPEITEIAAFLAGFELRRIRAVESTESGQDRLYETERKEKLKWLLLIKRGRIRLEGVAQIASSRPSAKRGTVQNDTKYNAYRNTKATMIGDESDLRFNSTES